ncbi:uncharacterized protein LOC103049872, partial [Python bivittatus]|uniref:Uncharacterized protein LOC103049872 n=1 Tax=Python bivittatus TaxID=176946 RepID=A0A9F2RDN7_PYTBI
MHFECSRDTDIIPVFSLGLRNFVLCIKSHQEGGRLGYNPAEKGRSAKQRQLRAGFRFPAVARGSTGLRRGLPARRKSRAVPPTPVHPWRLGKGPAQQRSPPDRRALIAGAEMAHLSWVLQPRPEAAEGTAEQPESYQLRQENELQVLESIYGRDFQDLRLGQPWKIRQPPEINLVLRPQGLTGDCEVYAKVDLWVKCPQTYPDIVPEIELKNVKGLSNENINVLKSKLEVLAKERCGE